MLLLAGKDLTSCSLVFEVLLCFATFPYGVVGQVWNLIVLISDLCLLTNLLAEFENISSVYSGALMVKTDLNYSKIYQTCPADTYLGTILTEEVNLISKKVCCVCEVFTLGLSR